MKELFLAGAKAKGYDAKTGERIFELLFAFSGYGFNKSHAAAYTIPAYHTIWLKANHPAEFIAANCTNDMNDTDRMAQLIREAREMGISVLPPDVNVSQKVFTVVNGKIVFGLLGIKNVGSGAVDAIIAEREANGPFASFVDFFDRIDSHEVNRKVAESLHHHGRVRPPGGDARHADAQPGPDHGALHEDPGGKALRAGVPVRVAGEAPAAAIELERHRSSRRPAAGK